MMTLDLRPKGLITDPNPHSSAPQGGMLQAENVVFRRDGYVEPRSTYANTAPAAPAANHEIRTAIPFDGDLLLISRAQGAETWLAQWESDGDDITGSWNLLPYGYASGHHTGFLVARRSLYFATNDGVLKLEAATDNAPALAGMPPGTSVRRTDAWSPGTPTVFTLFRVVFSRKDANGYIVRGAPGGGFCHPTILNNSQWQLRVPLPSEIVAGDVIEVYRGAATEIDSNIPSDTLQLDREITVTAGHVTAGYADITRYASSSGGFTAARDFTPRTISVAGRSSRRFGGVIGYAGGGVADGLVATMSDADALVESLGAALYTNEDQLGAAGAFYRPPICGAMEAFAGSVFFGDVKLVASKDVRFTNTEVGTPAGFALVSDAGFTCTTTSGSPTLTAVAGGWDAKVAAGMVITDNGTTATGPSIAGTNVPAGTTIVSVDTGAHTITMSANALASNTGVRVYAGPVFAVSGQSFYGWYEIVESADYPCFAAYPLYSGGDTTTLREMIESLAYIISRYLTDDEVTPYTLCLTEADARLLLTSTTFVSGDGGFNLQAWPASTCDPDLTAALAVSSETHKNRLYWSEPDMPEAVPVGNYAAVGREDKRILRLIATRDVLWILKEDGVWRLSGVAGSWRIDPFSPSTVLLARGAAGLLDDSVYAWTQRGLVQIDDGGVVDVSGPRIGNALASAEAAIAANGGCFGAWVAPYPRHGEVWLGVPSAAANTYASTIYVWNTRTQAFSTWTVDAFGAVANPKDSALYVAKRTSAKEYLLLTDVTQGAEAITCTVEWNARPQHNPAAQHLWADGILPFETVRGMGTATLTFTSDVSTSAVGGTLSFTAVASDRNEPLRFFVPREHARSTVLYPKLVVTTAANAQPLWRLSGLSCNYTGQTTRARRHAP